MTIPIICDPVTVARSQNQGPAKVCAQIRIQADWQSTDQGRNALSTAAEEVIRASARHEFPVDGVSVLYPHSEQGNLVRFEFTFDSWAEAQSATTRIKDTILQVTGGWESTRSAPPRNP